MESTLGKRITARRKQLGLTQDQLAEKLGLTAQAVSKWENDLSCPDISILPKLADIFGISIDELLGRESPIPVCNTEVVTNAPKQENGFTYDSDSGKMDFHWEGAKLGRIVLACWVLLTGILYLAVQFMNVEVSFWNVLWPSFLFAFGIFGLYPKFSGFRLGCGLFGTYVILCKLRILPPTLSNGVLVAVAVVLFGLGLLADALQKNKRRKGVCGMKNGKPQNGKICNEYHVDGTAFSYEASFGDSTQYIEMETLRHGSISVSFGDYTVDLRGIATVEAGCTITADCSFGELTLLVPRRYMVVADSSTSFASFEIDGNPNTNPDGTFCLLADASFGEICVKYI